MPANADIKASAHEADWAISVQGLIDRIHDEESARETIDDVVVLEHRLIEQKALKRFACEFCVLEARMWVHIATSDIAVESSELFTLRERNLVAWLRDKSEAQLLKVMARCARGMRLSNVRDAESSKRNRDETTEELERISDLIVSTGEETGETRLSSQVFYDNWAGPGVPSRTSVHAYRERTKVRLVSRGFNSTGDGSCMYYDPCRTTHEQNVGIIENLCENVLASIGSLERFCESTGEGVPVAMVARIVGRAETLARANG